MSKLLQVIARVMPKKMTFSSKLNLIIFFIQMPGVLSAASFHWSTIWTATLRCTPSAPPLTLMKQLHRPYSRNENLTLYRHIREHDPCCFFAFPMIWLKKPSFPRAALLRYARKTPAGSRHAIRLFTFKNDKTDHNDPCALGTLELSR